MTEWREGQGIAPFSTGREAEDVAPVDAPADVRMWDSTPGSADPPPDGVDGN
jgi:hypothetical protein